MRIAFDARAAAEVPAGRGRYVREVLRALSRARHDHEFVLWARQRWHCEDLDERFRWELVDAPSLAWPLRAGRRMSLDADVCLACTSYLMTATWTSPGAAVVWDFAPFERELGAPRGAAFERLTIRLALRKARVFIAISQATRDELHARFPHTTQDVFVAPPAADERFSHISQPRDAEVLRRHGITTPYVLVTGTLEPRKNLPRLMEAFVGLPAEVRAGRRLVLVGAAGWGNDATFRAIESHAELIQPLGFVDDQELPALYRGADLFAYVSLYEGFGIPVLEAMAAGTCVVTSGVSSMPEVGGDVALYVDPTDTDDIRRGLAEALGDDALRATRGSAGATRATLFSWDRTASAILQALESIPDLSAVRAQPSAKRSGE